MGFFKNIFKKPLKGLKRIGVAVATGGTSELLRAVAPKSAGFLTSYENLLFPTTFKQVLTTGSLVAAPYLGGAGFAGGGFGKATQFSQLFSSFSGQGGSPMALNIGGILQTIGGIATRTNTTGNPYIQGAGQLLSLAGQLTPTRTAISGRSPSRGPAPGAVMKAAPMAAARGLTKEIFDAGNKVLARLGIRYAVTASGFSSALRRSLGSIASLARRTPAGTMVNILLGLGLTVLEANMLTAWYAQRKKGRRMNPANSKALRRAARRIRSFHRLCTHTDLLKTRSRSAGRSRCGTCRKSPCRC